MKIGVIVDGQAESQALRYLFDNITLPGSQLLAPVYADMQPKATPAQIARSTYAKLCILQAKNVDKIVILIDFEDRTGCHVDFGDEIQKAFKKIFNLDVVVVVKKICFENWIISDPQGIGEHRSRVTMTKAFVDQVSPNKADTVTNPQRLLNSVCVKKSYHKRLDAITLSRTLCPSRMASNSRSFRKFLREVGFPAFLAQSKRPV